MSKENQLEPIRYGFASWRDTAMGQLELLIARMLEFMLVMFH